MKSLWVMSFLIAFSAEVRVKASGHKSASTAALTQVHSCAESWISAGHLLSGCHWIEAGDRYVLQTLYGQVIARHADFLVRVQDQRVYVSNHLGELKVRLKDGREIQVPPGFEFWISELGADKKNQMGLLAPIEMKTHTILLGRVWPGSSEDLAQRLRLYRRRWGNRVEMAAQFYQSLAQRKIASIEEKNARSERTKLRVQRQREANRRLLYERVFGR